MIDPGPTQVRGTTERAGQLAIVRRMSLGMTVALLAEYALGMVANLYVTVPARDQGGGVLTAIGRAFANGPAALAIHAGLGVLIVVGGINLLVRSVLSRHRPLIWLSAVAMLAILGAASSGAAFVNSGSDGASLGMALLTGVALLCLTVSLYLTGVPGTARPVVRDTAGQGSAGQDAAIGSSRGRSPGRTLLTSDDAGDVARVVARACPHGFWNMRMDGSAVPWKPNRVRLTLGVHAGPSPRRR